ncbi:hypothetical protein ACFL35_02775 [Candidatus Riflebacteria bacterium]
MTKQDFIPSLFPGYLGFLVIAALLSFFLGIFFAEYYFYNFSVRCLDGIFAVSPLVIEDFKKTNALTRFEPGQEYIYKFITDLKKTGYYYCQEKRMPFIWIKPGGMKYKERPVLFKCSIDGHGWFRKYSWGAYILNEKFHLLKITPDGKIEEIK